MNEAVDKYLDDQAASVEVDLEDTLQRNKAYRIRISKVRLPHLPTPEADGSAEDPVEGRTTRAQRPARRRDAANSQLFFLRYAEDGDIWTVHFDR